MKKIITIILLVLVFLLVSFEIMVRSKPSVNIELWDLTIPMMAPIEAAIDAFYLNNGAYPNNLKDLIVCPAGFEDKWKGPYLKEKQLIDPWGYEYIYHPVGTFNPGSYDIISYGKDGKPGGKGYNADEHN